jgi:hypothetical protein
MSQLARRLPVKPLPPGALRLRDDRQRTIHREQLAEGWSLIIPSAVD